MDELEEIRKRKLRELEERLRYPDSPLELSDGNFRENAGKYPLFVADFWSASCPPCALIAPVIDELARELSGKAVFGKLNIDMNRKTAMEFGIMSIPTLIIFKGGERVGQIIGAVPKERILGKLRNYME
ncbi:MAG: thioredoxin fold domain-containing protein [Candidatus Aenigmarchaeota archaeon]|nr:thioredoxin fold domain-containing protein [Candidatus Aenigmarchaeota archaeon]